jgi:hypothetical protein
MPMAAEVTAQPGNFDQAEALKTLNQSKVAENSRENREIFQLALPVHLFGQEGVAAIRRRVNTTPVLKGKRICR